MLMAEIVLRLSLHTVTDFNWTQDCEGKTIIAHSGGLPGFGSHWGIMPDYGIGIVCLANRTYAGAGRVNVHILDTLVKRAGLERRVLPPSRILEQRRKELIALFPDWQNASSSGIFAENFFADNPVDSLIKYTRLNYAEAGKVISVSEVRAENQLRGDFVIKGDNKDIRVYFTLSPENPALIQEFKIYSVAKNHSCKNPYVENKRKTPLAGICGVFIETVHCPFSKKQCSMD